ncbi:MAG: hypothetical protein ACW99X_18030, partial [Candidatus Thorarchaeota archaeon]
MKDRKLVIIFGAPRTATTHLLQALLEHDCCFGGMGAENSNEPNDINLEDPTDTAALDERYERLSMTKENPEYLVLKSPGYCMYGWDYFSRLDRYESKFIQTDRNPIEIVDSMMNHDISRTILDMEIESTDCPKDKLELLKPKWDAVAGHIDEQRWATRAYVRYAWHVQSMSPGLNNNCLRLTPYKSRLYVSLTASMILGWLRLPRGSDRWYEILREFQYRDI